MEPYLLHTIPRALVKCIRYMLFIVSSLGTHTLKTETYKCHGNPLNFLLWDIYVNKRMNLKV